MSKAIHTPAFTRQAKRIRWQHGVSEHAARVIAGLAFGEVRQ